MFAATSVPSLRAATPATVGRRACAVLAAASAVLHGVMLGHAGNPAIAVLMVAMIAVCLFCARDLWLRGTLRTWCIVAVMNLAMVAIHLPAPVHHHMADAGAGHQPTVMAAATALSLVEVGAAAAVLWFRTRRGAQLVSGKPVR